MKHGALLLLVLLPIVVFASEIDDLRVISGFYSRGDYQHTRVEIENFLDTYPNSAYKWYMSYLLAEIALYEKEYRKASDLFEQVMQNQPDPSIRPNTQYGLGKARFQLEDFDRARDLLHDFIQRFPQHGKIADALHLLGRIAFRTGDSSRALELYDRSLKRSENPEVLLDKVYALLAQDKTQPVEVIIGMLSRDGHTEQAEIALLAYNRYNLAHGHSQKVLAFMPQLIPESSPRHDRALLYRLMASNELGQYDKALELYHEIRQPDDNARYQRGIALINLNRFQEAKDLFNALRNSPDTGIATNSLFFLARIESKTDPKESNRMLTAFLQTNPKNAFRGEALYLIAKNHFDSGDFSLAADNLKLALQEDMTNEQTANARFLLGESFIQLNRFDDSRTAFNEFLERIPDSRLEDEVRFKLGLVAYFEGNLDEADRLFDIVINRYPQSSKLGLTYYYKGEIQMRRFMDILRSMEHQGEKELPDKAREIYAGAQADFKRALNHGAEEGAVWERLTRLHYLAGNLTQAMETLYNIPMEPPRFKYLKFLLKGHIHFVEHEYYKAIDAYRTADEVAANPDQKREVAKNMAWAYYQLKQFDQAKSLFEQLSADGSGEYQLLAAKAAFGGGEYREAIRFWNDFLQNDPQGEDYYRALNGIAASWYNLKDYHRSILYYRELIKPDTPELYLADALDGLRWACESSDVHDFQAELDQILTGAPNVFAVQLLESKAQWQKDQARYEEAISTAQHALGRTAENSVKIRLMELIAQCDIQLKRFTDADETYRRIDQIMTTPDPEFLWRWGRLKLQLDRKNQALQLMKSASGLTSNTSIWMDMMELQIETGDSEFPQTYDRFLDIATRASLRDQSRILYARYLISTGSPAPAIVELDKLTDNRDGYIKALAHYWKGYALWKSNQMDDAIRTLLRVRYLDSDQRSVILDAEYLATKLYLQQGKKDKAESQFSIIKNELDEERRTELERLLK